MDNTWFAIYTEDPAGDPNKRIYFRPTEPEQSGTPWRNRIVGHELQSESEFASPRNFVFLPGPKANSRGDRESQVPETTLLPADGDNGQ